MNRVESIHIVKPMELAPSAGGSARPVAGDALDGAMISASLREFRYGG